MKQIILDAPNLGRKEKEKMIECIDSTYVSTNGPYVSEFEERVAAYLGTKKAISVQSGTAGLHLALYELGIKEGDEVIVPVLTFIATANPIRYMRATPVFIDVDINTWNIDPVAVEKAITKRTKAIIPVHLYGNPCDMDALTAISKRYGIPMIEDATESLGASYKGKMTGTFGEYGVLSFNGNKIITTGGGGMIVTDNEASGQHLKFLVNQARDVSKGYYHPEVGFNYRMTNLEASLGLAQFDRLEEFLDAKIHFAKEYEKLEAFRKDIRFQKQYPEAKSAYWLNSIIFNNREDINEIELELRQKGIPTRRIFMPIVEFPVYKTFRTSEYPNAYYIYRHGLNLPSSTVNDIENIRFVVDVLKNI